jgi:hypothetical protein
MNIKASLALADWGANLILAAAFRSRFTPGRAGLLAVGTAVPRRVPAAARPTASHPEPGRGALTLMTTARKLSVSYWLNPEPVEVGLARERPR